MSKIELRGANPGVLPELETYTKENQLTIGGIKEKSGIKRGIGAFVTRMLVLNAQYRQSVIKKSLYTFELN